MIRLQRVGRKNDPSFRVVVVDSHESPKTGKVIEVVGSYNARQGGATFNGERIVYWLSLGAQASGTVHNLLVDKKIITAKKLNVLPKRKAVTAELNQAETKTPMPASEVAAS